MNDLILQQLENIERTKGVKVLYACETGSRAWGFPSPDSDYDVRIIYKHDLDWYLSLGDKKDTIEYMSDDGQLDVTGWDIRKCLKLMWKSNAALLERVQSPIIYRDDSNISALLRDTAFECFSPIATMHHYLSMAKNSFAEIEGKEEIKLKKLFYALRAAIACKWMLHRNSPPPIVFTTMVDELDFYAFVKQHIAQLIELKAGKSESYMHPAEHDLNVLIKSEIDAASEIFQSLRGRKTDLDLDDIFRQILKTY